MRESIDTARWLKALALAVLVSPACAQELERSSLSTIPSGPATRRLEIVISDNGSQHSVEVAPAPDEGPLSEPIVGTMLCAKGRFAVTPTRMLAVGNAIGGFRVTAVTLDSVSLAKGLKVHEYDLRNGTWSETTTQHAE